MKPRTLLLSLAALITAGITAFLVNGWMENQRVRPVAVAKKAEVLQVLVAKRNLGAGTFMKPQDTVWQSWPEGNLSPAYAIKGKRKQNEFAGSVVRSRIVAGQPVTDANVVKVGERGFLAAVVQPGLRAVSFPINASSGVSGLVFPGDRVDILLSHKLKVASGGRNVLRTASETVLTNVRILAMDARTNDQKTKKGKGSIAKTVTVEVTPKQAEMVSVALNLGKLSLSLRSLAKFGATSEDDQKEDRTASRGKTMTLDGDVSRLLHVKDETDSITVLRGGGAKVDAIPKGAPQK
jgi:pilus assembly protein CpaB